MWHKHGLIYNLGKAQCPVVCKNEDYWRIYFTDRNEKNQNIANFIDVEPGNPAKVKTAKKTILQPGKPGDCDSAGVMPTAFYNNNLYYIGWTLRQDVPYFNYTCVAQKYRENYVKLGPVLSPTLNDPGYSGTLGIYQSDYILFGYYLSCVGWLPDENNKLQPSYNIKMATSLDGIRWNKLGKTAIDLEEDEAGISSATVIKKRLYHMWFCVRKAKNFRNKKENSYKIKHATSEDGYTWTRDEKYAIFSELEFEKIMCAYPNVIVHEDKIHMFYNGDGFGQTGIAHATMELKYLC